MFRLNNNHFQTVKCAKCAKFQSKRIFKRFSFVFKLFWYLFNFNILLRQVDPRINIQPETADLGPLPVSIVPLNTPFNHSRLSL